MSSQRKAWSIPEWGDQYGFSRAKAYGLVAAGQGPKTIRVGKAQLVTEEADQDWRRRLSRTAKIEASA